MRVGSLVYATEQGLGHLAKSFWDAGVLTDVLTVAHGKRKEHPEWYPGARRINDLSRQFNSIRELCRSVDVMLFFETPFNWEVIPYCRSIGVPTVLMPMYECLPPVTRLPYQPDRFLCPSKLDLHHFPDTRTPPRSEFIPVPVDGVRWRQREKAKTFVHNAGWGGLQGRNGTKELVDAIHLVKSSAEFIIRGQDSRTMDAIRRDLRGDPRVRVESGTLPRESLWDEGDVFVFPEKFNGLSLPLQEARAAGMLVMATYRFPNLDWLPHEPLISPGSFRRGRVSARCTEFDEAVMSPELIAEKIDEWWGRDMSSYSLQGREWGRRHSWEALLPYYREYFERVTREHKGGVR